MSRLLSSALRALPALAALVLVFGASREAHASSGTSIGVDLDYTHAISEQGVGSGSGFNLSLIHI